MIPLTAKYLAVAGRQPLDTVHADAMVMPFDYYQSIMETMHLGHASHS
jgi:hypothetical protein